MRSDEPLEGWLFYVRMLDEGESIPRRPGEARKALDLLAATIAAVPEGPVNYNRVRGRVPSVYTNYWLTPDETLDAQRLFFQVWERGGTGSSHVVDGLLQAIALATQPVSIPFWRQLLDLIRPREKAVTERRVMALAALALLAVARNNDEAYAALAEALDHPHEQVRALGAFYLGRAYLESERPLPAPVEATLTEHGANDAAFAPRFQARAALDLLERPVPRDDPELVYFFKVQLRSHRATRTIAALPEDTLSDLHYAIQGAFDWDADHLYSFFMLGSRDEWRYEIRCPELGDGWGDASDDDAPDTTSTEIGTLGLVPNHQFIYFFDYGDNHQFVVTVLGIETRADDGEYPRVIEARGKAPRQYRSYDNEDDED